MKNCQPFEKRGASRSAVSLVIFQLIFVDPQKARFNRLVIFPNPLKMPVTLEKESRGGLAT